MLRLASSTVVPFALRDIASPRILPQLSITNAFNGSNHDSFFRPNCYSHHFSTDSKKLLDRVLVKLVKSEIKSKKLSLDESMPQPPPDFPFTIQDNPYEKELILTRELAGEKIFVSVSMPKFIPEDGDDDESNFRCKKCGRALPVFLYVKITKENGKMLAFTVCVSADTMNVCIMSFAEPALESDDGSLVLFGPHNVDDVDDDLQSALREYLEIRGIRKCDAMFLFKYMVKKSKRDPLHVLEKLRKFIKE